MKTRKGVQMYVYVAGHAKRPREEVNAFIALYSLSTSHTVSRGFGSSLKFILQRELTLQMSQP